MKYTDLRRTDDRGEFLSDTSRALDKSRTCVLIPLSFEDCMVMLGKLGTMHGHISCGKKVHPPYVYATCICEANSAHSMPSSNIYSFLSTANNSPVSVRLDQSIGTVTAQINMQSTYSNDPKSRLIDIS